MCCFSLYIMERPGVDAAARRNAAQKTGRRLCVDYREQYNKIYRYCYFRLRHKETAEDITQESFLQYLKHPEYGGEREPLKILYTIARNLCADEARRGGRISFVPQEELPEYASDSASEEDIICQARLREAMDALEEAEREIVFLKIVNEVPTAVIAKTLGISRFAVYRRCERALKLLRKEMEADL